MKTEGVFIFHFNHVKYVQLTYYTKTALEHCASDSDPNPHEHLLTRFSSCSAHPALGSVSQIVDS